MSNNTKNEIAKTVMRKGLFDSKHRTKKGFPVNIGNMLRNITRDDVIIFLMHAGALSEVFKALPKRIKDHDLPSMNMLIRAFSRRTERAEGDAIRVFKTIWNKMSEVEQRMFFEKLPKSLLLNMNKTVFPF